MRFIAIILSAYALIYALPAQAVTISNCDEIERKVTINNAGEIREHVLAPARSIEANGPMVTAQVEKGLPIRMQDRDVYCIRKGKISLQMRRKYSNKRQ